MISPHRLAFVTLSLLGSRGATTGFAQTPSIPPQPNIEVPSRAGGNSVSEANQVIPAGDLSLPPMGEPGKCYARVWEPAVYRNVTEKLLVKEASEQIEIIPATYEWVEERVLVKKAYERDDVIPATYDTITEKVLVKPATTKWEKGRGLVEKVDNFTGEIMCLKAYPAEYKTITKQVLKTPASVTKVQVPAEYQTIKVRKLIAPASEKRIPIPAQYQTVTKTVLKSQGLMAWKSVICETNAPANVSIPEGVTAINTQPASTAVLTPTATSTQKSEDDWFFYWDYDELFDRGTWTPAHESR